MPSQAAPRATPLSGRNPARIADRIAAWSRTGGRTSRRHAPRSNTPGTAAAPSKLKELGQFAIPAAHDEGKAVGFGDLSVHEVAFSEKDPNIAYVSYYAGGTRVYDISGNTIKEIAYHVDADGSNVWGVQVFQSGGKEYVAASDRDYGIQIFELTGPKSVND